jgi:hypothetical protein
VRFISFDCNAHVWFGSLFDCWCVVRPVSQLHFNLIFFINKVSSKSFSYHLSQWMHLMMKHGQTGFSTSICLTQRPGPSHARGLPVMDRHHPFRASGGVGLKNSF